MIKLIGFVIIYLVATMAISETHDFDKPYYDLENAEDLFQDFIKQYRKLYSRKEYFERLEIFKVNLQDINRRNAMFPKTLFAVNHFADLKPEELQQFYGFKRSNRTSVKVTIPDSLTDLPEKFDWRDEGIVSHVKRQGCGDCFIFSAIGNIEGQYNRKYKQCIALSEQQALDCLDSGSCDGGCSLSIMQDFSKNTGVMKEEDYPNKGEKGICEENANKVVAHVQGAQEINIPDEDTLKQKLVEIGPLAVSLASQDLIFYVNGVLHPHLCTGKPHDHAVVLVGYGKDHKPAAASAVFYKANYIPARCKEPLLGEPCTDMIRLVEVLYEDGTKYWIIKNSWGEIWGEKGYLRLLRGVDACRMGTSFTASATVA